MRAAPPVIGITCGTTSLEGQTPRYGTNQAYVEAVAAAGGIPLLLPPGTAASAAAVLDHIDGLLVPGGADIDPSFYGADRIAEVVYTDPARDAVELSFISEAHRRAMPVFGICRGMQMINVVFGGTLYQDVASELPHALRHKSPPELGRGHLEHDIQVSAGSWFAEASGATALLVNSLHHQAVRDVGEGLVVTATSEDGVIEGLETADRRTVAIQCHTEELLEYQWARGLFESFVRATTH
jgi:putative glutamine amidotransferase